MNLVDRLRWLLLTGFGTGLAPVASGTFGTLPAVVIGILLAAVIDGWLLVSTLLGAATVLFAFGCLQTRFCARVIPGEDPGQVVLDEIVGYFVTLAVGLSFGGAASPAVHVAAFLAFRVFDVLKPPPADRLEELPGALGVMADDVMAGIYAGGVILGLRALDWI